MRFLIFCCVCSALLFSDVNAKAAIKKKADYFKLISATTQRTLPGIPGVAIKTESHFIIVWRAAAYPKTFFWRGENGWLPCHISRSSKTKNGGRGKMVFEEVTNRNIHRGDTLQLTPVPGGKFPVPAEIPADAKNTLFLQAGSSGWLSYPVKKINMLPDIVNP